MNIDSGLDIEQRVAALTKVADHFNGKVFKLGEDDCAHLINYGMSLIGRKTSLMSRGSYSTPAQARRALKRAGFASLRDAVTAEGFLELDAPSFSLPLDILAMPSEGEDDVALAFMASGGRAFGFWNGLAQYFQPVQFITAWRV